MGKRYTFWRTPTGAAYTRSDDKYAPVALLKACGELASINSEGNLQWRGFFVDRLRTALRSSAMIVGPDGEDLNGNDSWSIIWRSIKKILRNSGGGTAIAPQKVLSEADKLASEFYRKEPTPYILVSGISVKHLPAKTIRIRSSVITPLPKRATHYKMPPVVTDRVSGGQLNPSKFTPIKISTSGRSIYEATNRAISDLAVLRGLWTLFNTYGAWTMSFGMRKRIPLGIIHGGPIHTLHNLDGSPVSDIYWYEPDYAEDVKVFDAKDWKETERHRKWALRRLKSVEYGNALFDIIARYAIALDQLQLDVAFLHLWSILEKITDTVGANYDETIRRTVWPYRDRDLAASILDCMRLYRNRLVHASQSSDEQDQVALLVKSFVDPHLLRLLRNDFEVSDFKEYGRHLSLPTDVETLTKQATRLRRAAKFMRRVEKEAKSDK